MNTNTQDTNVVENTNNDDAIQKINRNEMKYKNIANNSNLVDTKKKVTKHTLHSILDKKEDIHNTHALQHATTCNHMQPHTGTSCPTSLW